MFLDHSVRSAIEIYGGSGDFGTGADRVESIASGSIARMVEMSIAMHFAVARLQILVSHFKG